MKSMAMQSGLPSWLERLRRHEIVERVRGDRRSRGGTILGLSADDAKKATEWGQADFDAPWRGLTPSDRVLLYAYFMQPRHLEELTNALRQLFREHRLDSEPVVLDLGCGPCTGGLALAATLGADASCEYIGVDRSDAMRELGARLASIAVQDANVAAMNCRWAAELGSVEWESPPSWRSVLVIVSYLFASPTLNPMRLANDLNQFLKRIGRGSVAILYTNSAREQPNRGFTDFAKGLKQFGFSLITEDTGQIQSQRRDRSYSLRYALFFRARGSVLRGRDGR